MLTKRIFLIRSKQTHFAEVTILYHLKPGLIKTDHNTTAGALRLGDIRFDAFIVTDANLS